MSVEKVQELREKMSTPNTFKAGEVVRWKNGLKNKRWPETGERVVVFESKTTPVYDENTAGSPYFMEPLDLVICRIDDDGYFCLYHVDSRRFELAL